MDASTSAKLSKNLTSEITSEYEHYMKTFIYKVPKRDYGDDIFIKPISRLDDHKVNKTMYAGYNKTGMRYSNLSRLMEKVFPREALTNKFFSSMNKSGYNQSVLKRQRLSFY